MKRLLLIGIMLAMSVPLHGGTPRECKKEVRRVIRQVTAISRHCRSIDELGRNTLKQSTELLNIGGPAVYALSPCLATEDWKVRFWIADILGYLNNQDARRPLLRLLSNRDEPLRVRRQAYRSLRKLNVPIPDELKQGL